MSMPEAFYQEEDNQDHPAEDAGHGKRGVRALLHRQFFGRGDGAPGISTVMVDAFNIVQDRIARSRLAGDPPDVMVSPRLQDVGLFDFHRAEEAIECGSQAVERQLDDIIREIGTQDRKRVSSQSERGRAQPSSSAMALQPVAK